MSNPNRRERAKAIVAQIEELRAKVRDNAATMTGADQDAATAAAQSLNKQLQAVLTEGAQPCPSCETPAFGLMHESATGKGKAIRHTFEVGCKNAACRDHRATDLLPELAVERWNAEDYDAPRKIG